MLEITIQLVLMEVSSKTYTGISLSESTGSLLAHTNLSQTWTQVKTMKGLTAV
jgi:hypothetical protein